MSRDLQRGNGSVVIYTVVEVGIAFVMTYTFPPRSIVQNDRSDI